jgi:hypothetical protein
MMPPRALGTAFLLALLTAACPAPAAADDAKKDGLSLTDLSLEVNALLRMHYFKVTPSQMDRLQKLAKETAEKPRKRKAGQASDDLREALESLHGALVEDLDDDQIDSLEERLDDLREAEKPALDDDVEITDAARRRAPEVLRQLSARQVAAYIAANSDDLHDPLERLTEALAKAQELKARAWKELRDETAEEVGLLVAGLDEEKSEKVSSKALTLLSRARGLTAEEFRKQQPELEKEARRIVGDVQPTDVLRHAAEYALAELLSNPRLEAALKARRK